MAIKTTDVTQVPRRPRINKKKLSKLIDAFPETQYPITGAMAKILGQLVPNDLRGRTYAEAVVATLIRKARQGRTRAARELADRIGGTVRSAQQNSSSEKL